MTLQRKFVFLLAGLALAVVINLGTTVWAVQDLERELARPLRSIATVQGGLNRIKRRLGEVADYIPRTTSSEHSDGGSERPDARAASGRSDAAAGPEIGVLERSIRRELQQLEATDEYLVRTGISNARNIRVRIDAAFEATSSWLADRAPAGALTARSAFHDLHELIERSESKILVDGSLASEHGQAVRRQVLVMVSASLAVTLLSVVLGATLIRRWIVAPVASLRDAAAAIARGDFSHRVPVAGDDELARLSSEVNHMAGMIAAMQEERVDRERLAAMGEMVRRLAHNLRNPLAGIRSLAELTRLDLPARSPAHENQDRIVSTVDRFEKWLAELLSATRPLELRPGPCAIPDWLAAVVETLRPMASARGVEIRIATSESPAQAVIDRHHLEQALVGILTNAIQATPSRSTVRVVARASENGQDWEIRVEDRGPGVPKDLMDKIFRPYFTTKRDGTGIGLAVARQVVEQHGGRIWVEDGSGHAETASVPAPEGNPGGPGAAFVICLPVQGVPRLANTGQDDGKTGASLGQDSDSRGRGEPAVLHPPGAEARRS